MNDLESIAISSSTVSLSNTVSDTLLLYGNDTFDDIKNTKMEMLAIRLFKDSQRFDEQFL